MLTYFKIGSINVTAIRSYQDKTESPPTEYDYLSTVIVPNRQNLSSFLYNYSLSFFEANKNSSYLTYPKITITPEIEDGIASYKNFLSQVFDYVKHKDSNLRILHLIDVKNKDYKNNFKGIFDAIQENKYERQMALFFDVDDKVYEDFCVLFADFPFRNAIANRFNFLLFGFSGNLRTMEYDSYLKDLIDLLYRERNYEKTILDILDLMSQYLGPRADYVEGYIRKEFKDEFDYFKTNFLKKGSKGYKRFVYDSVQLYINLNKILNRIDPTHIAFICEFEYDIYVKEIMDDLKRFDNPESIYNYLVKSLEIKRDLNYLTHWGEDYNSDFSAFRKREDYSILSEEEEEEEIDTDSSPTFEHPQRKRVRLSTKLKWGAKEIHKELVRFVKKNERFIVLK
jgi:hypothetical protein